MQCLWCVGHRGGRGGWWRSTGIRAGKNGGTVEREWGGYHIFTGISSFKIFIRRFLSLYLFSAPPSRHGSLWSLAVWSDMVFVHASLRVCVGGGWPSQSRASASKSVCMPAPDYPLSLLITTLCHSSSFYQSPHRTLRPPRCHLSPYFHPLTPSPHPPPSHPHSLQKSKHRFLQWRTPDFSWWTNTLFISAVCLSAAVTPGRWLIWTCLVLSK